jgi:hypothetical protein
MPKIKRRETVVTVLDSDDIADMSAASFVDAVNKAFAQIPAEHKERAYYNADDSGFQLYYYRMETDEELREKAERMRAKGFVIEEF